MHALSCFGGVGWLFMTSLDRERRVGSELRGESGASGEEPSCFKRGDGAIRGQGTTTVQEQCRAFLLFTDFLNVFCMRKYISLQTEYRLLK